jgi:glucose-6-phosphate isomerase
MELIKDNNLLEISYINYQDQIKQIHQGVADKELPGQDYSGWLEQVADLNQGDINRVTTISNKLKEKAQIMVVIGIGGSYLGTRAVESALNDDLFYQKKQQLIYAGQNTSSDYYQQICDYLEDKDFVINVISKSGKTLEPTVGFSLFNDLLITKYGAKEAPEHIVITTTADEKVSPLYQYATQKNIATLPIPEDIGGRYSVFTAASLLPLVFVGLDIKQFIDGAQKALEENFNDDVENNAAQYAINRYEQYNNKKAVEALVINDPSLHYFSAWYQQLFAESEGKDHKGLLPIGIDNPTDLHSLGQFIQDGSPILFETHIQFSKYDDNVTIPTIPFKGLDTLKVTSLNKLNELISTGVKQAHTQGKVPNLTIELETKDEFNMGYLMMFMMISCVYSSYLLDVNPFDQPGVELYKEAVQNLL